MFVYAALCVYLFACQCSRVCVCVCVCHLNLCALVIKSALPSQRSEIDILRIKMEDMRNVKIYKGD